MPETTETDNARQRPPLRVGLIGVTGYALAYFEELNKLAARGEVEWGAVTIINREVAAGQVAFFESAGVPIYPDYREMLETEKDRLDWVCVPTAIEWHARMAVDALRLGLPVLLEKPVAPTLQEVDQIQAAERETGQPVAIGFQHNYSDSTWAIKQRLLEGAIGEIRSIDSICLWPRAQSYYRRNEWAGRLFVDDDWVLDSPLHNAISHVINLILFFAGPELGKRADLKAVSAELYRAKPIQSYDTVRCEAELDTGARARVILSHSTRSSVDPEIRITGTKGSFLWRFCGLHTFESGGKEETFGPEDQVQVREGMFRNVVQLVRGDRSVRICTTEQAKGEVKWVNGVQDAAPIHDVPEAYRQHHTGDDGEAYDSIENFDAVAMTAYREGCWLCDLDVPWAVTPERLDMTAYNAFLARKIPAPSPELADPAR